MAWIQNGIAGSNLGGTVTTITVPAGVTANQTCLFTISGSAGAATVISTTPSSSNGSAVIATIINLADVKNSFLSVYNVTGLVAGDTFTVTTGANSNGRLSHFYFDTPLVTWGSLATRNATNQNFVVAPSATVAAGSTVYAYAMSRITTSTTLSSVSNSNGRTLTQLYSDYTTAAPAVNVNLWQFTEPTTDTGTTTVTESGSSTNAAAFHFAEYLPISTTTAWFRA